MKSHKLCCYAPPPSLPHNCRSILFHTSDSLSLPLFLSPRWGLGFFFFFFFCLLLTIAFAIFFFFFSFFIYLSFQTFNSFLFKILGSVWYMCVNNSFQCLNIETHIFITFFNLYIFSQYSNNDTRNL